VVWPGGAGCAPLTTSTGAVQRPWMRRETHIPTSGLPSRFPPNQAAASVPSGSSTIVEAWHWGVGAWSGLKTNSAMGFAGFGPGFGAAGAAAKDPFSATPISAMKIRAIKEVGRIRTDRGKAARILGE
jgi:hypothetical protein